MNDGAMRNTVLHFSCNHQSVMPDTMRLQYHQDLAAGVEEVAEDLGLGRDDATDSDA